jgi:predicted permease
MIGLMSDLRYIIRGWLRAPSFPLNVIATVGFSLAVTSALFSFIDGYLFRPLPFSSADSLYYVRDSKSGTGLITRMDLMRLRSSALAEMGFVEWSNTDLGSGDLIVGYHRVEVSAVQISEDFRKVIGFDLLLGRDFSSADHAAPKPAVAWISYRLWASTFGKDASVVGRRLSIETPAGPLGVTIVGVLGPNVVSFEENNRPPDIILPMADLPGRARLALPIIRLPEGGSTEVARQRISAVLSGDGNVGLRSVSLASLSSAQLAGGIPTARVLLATSLLLALLAATTLVHLILVRTEARSAETGLRISLGASVWRVVRVFLMEDTLLAFSGIALGLAIGSALSHELAALVPVYPSGGRNLSLVPITFDTRVVVATCALGALMVALGAGIPILKCARRGTGSGGGKGTASARLSARSSKWLLASQVAVVTTIVVTTTSLSSSIWMYLNQPLGFDVSGRFVATLAPKALRRATDVENDEAVRAIAQSPRVQAVGSYEPGQLPESSIDEASSVHGAVGSSVGPGYREAWNLRLTDGRWFDPREFNERAPVAVVDSRYAAQLSIEVSPLGATIRVSGIPRKVVGIVAPRRRSLNEQGPPEIYVPTSKLVAGNSFIIYAPSLSPAEAQSQLNSIVEDAVGHDMALRVYPLTFDGMFLRDIGEARFQAPILASIGLLALLLAAAGVFGLVSYVLGCRLKDFGIRLALGASTKDTVRSVALLTLLPAVIGGAVGLLGSRLVAEVLDATTFGWIAPGFRSMLEALSLLVVVVGAATVGPLLRVLRVRPSDVLRVP